MKRVVDLLLWGNAKKGAWSMIFFFKICRANEREKKAEILREGGGKKRIKQKKRDRNDRIKDSWSDQLFAMCQHFIFVFFSFLFIQSNLVFFISVFINIPPFLPLFLFYFCIFHAFFSKSISFWEERESSHVPYSSCLYEKLLETEVFEDLGLNISMIPKIGNILWFSNEY